MGLYLVYTWVVVKIRVPVWVPIIMRHLLYIYIYIYLGYPKRDHNFDNHLYLLTTPVRVLMHDILTFKYP